MFINRWSSSKFINPSAGTRSQIVAFNRVPSTEEKGLNFRDRATKNFWVGLLYAIGDWLLSGDRPHIEEKRDRNGNLYFKVYDPCSQNPYIFDSESEVRAWLDRRYNY